MRKGDRVLVKDIEDNDGLRKYRGKEGYVVLASITKDIVCVKLQFGGFIYGKKSFFDKLPSED